MSFFSILAPVLGVGLSLLGMKEQSKAAKSVAGAQVAAGDRAAQAQLEMFYQSREDMTPWRVAGEQGLEGLENITQQYFDVLADPSQYVQSPGYNFLMEQGVGALARGASAAGKLDSGQYSKDLMQFGQGLASQDYGNYLNRLLAGGNQFANIAGLGQSTAVAGGQMGQQTGANLGNIYQGQGNALAAGAINQANVRTGLYSNIANIGSNALNQYMMYQGMSGGARGYQLPADIQSFQPNYLMR